MVIIKIHEVYVESQGFCLFAPPIFFISEMLRERPLGYGFFLNVAEKNILILVEEKKTNRIQSHCYIT
jgi:hypothetical protein